MITTTLYTERLILQPVTPAFIRHLFATQTEGEIKRSLGTDDAGYNKYKEMYEGGMETYQISFCYFLLKSKQNNLAIGECGFHTWNKKHARAEIFYSIRNGTDKRQGYMKEALPVVLQFGFDELGLHRIEGLVAAWNVPSIKLLYGCGFTREGTMRQDYLYNGQYEDSDCYSLLRDEWLDGGRR